MSEITLTRAGFEAWLRNLAPHARVGYRGCAGSCPLAAYLRSQGALWPEVQLAQWRHGDGHWCDLPEWALSFRRRVDFGRISHAIQARTCLALLAGIPETEQ